jgi:hypothetical protein
LPANREHVKPDCSQRCELARNARKPQKPPESEDPTRDERDVLSRDGQQVIETRRTKVLADLLRESLVLAENDAENQRAPNADRTAADRVLHPVPQAVPEAGDPTSGADLPPGATAQDDLDSLARQPGALVESSIGLPRLADAHGRLQDRSTRRRSANREQEENPLPEARLAESRHLGLDANRPWRCARRTRDYELRRRRFADLTHQRALPHRLEPQSTPPKTSDRENRSDCDEARTVGEQHDGSKREEPG